MEKKNEKEKEKSDLSQRCNKSWGSTLANMLRETIWKRIQIYIM